MLAEVKKTIAANMLRSFPQSNRGQIGRELEFPLITKSKQPGESQRVIETLLAQGARPLYKDERLVGAQFELFSFCSEAGRSTIEWVSTPCADLHALKSQTLQALSTLNQALVVHDYQLLGLGIHPYETPGAKARTPKVHYQSLAKVLGHRWDWFTVICGDHVHIDTCQRELLSMTSALDMAIPFVVAQCANSPLKDQALCDIDSYREYYQFQHRLEPSRHGIVGEPITSMEQLIEPRFEEQFLLHHSKCSGTYSAVGVPFSDWVRHHVASSQEVWEAFQFHQHYTWNSVRARQEYGTIEVRAGCLPPEQYLWLYPAIITGLSTCHKEVTDLILSFLPDKSDRLQWYQDCLKGGAGVKYHELHRQLEALAHQGLERRGLGEETMLVHPELNPAQQFRNAVLKSSFDSAILERIYDLNNVN
ncbi:glutamate-cysteine ligase family protein [Vibrio brasiliensis]|uniref:glutamate-cysteine ligase family protein n=1 Tax=Vibrio brasiliensis TaxID=170652 RepID=UPI001EFCAD8D|nr:glutamate-cysteine ligase family protein [Vibrio brasiliensis]